MITFADLYERRADYIYFLCSRLEMNEEKAERLNHEVWRRVHRQLPQLQSQGEEIWLCTKLIDSHRKMIRNAPPGKLDFRGTSDEARLAQAVMNLSPEHRWPLVLRECAGFNYGDLAEILNIPEGTVKARLARARGLVRKVRSEGAE